MTNAEWADGMIKLLKAGMPGWPSNPLESAARSDLYREHLDDLVGPAWAHAVVLAIRNERWFPTVAALRAYADEYKAPAVALLERPRTEEQKEQDRELARRKLAEIEAAFHETVKDLPPTPPVNVPEPRAVVVASDERMDLLRRQAAEILAEARR